MSAANSKEMQEEARQLWLKCLSLSVYRHVTEQPAAKAAVSLVEALAGGDCGRICDRWGNLCAVLAAAGRLDSLPGALADEVLGDDNVFSSALSSKQAVPQRLAQAALRDLDVLWQVAGLSPVKASVLLSDCAGVADTLPQWGNLPAAAPMDMPWGESLQALESYHAVHGCGRFSKHIAFLWRDSQLLPVEHPDPIRLHNLKGYEYQRRIAVDNTRAFLNGFEANNMLLYGDRGTGKSSTVKALLNEYAREGLRMIEMPKEYLRQLPDLTGYLAGLPMKFIIFIDDLSFSSGDDNFAALKAVLEGGLASRPENVIIYATSNRRHLLRETFGDRQGDEVHHADTVQESVSLSDRFGISLTFLMPDKQRFMEIVEQIASDRGLQVERDALLAAAERWALERGGRSPRYARQFIADAEARLSRGETL